MHVRRARPEDYAAVGAVTVAAYQPFLLGPDDPYVLRLANVEARALEAELWVAVEPDDRTVLGNVTLCREGSPWREVGRAGEGEFRMLAVDPAAQGRGVGRMLARHCLDRFREEGATGVVLSSLEAMAAAHRLYESLGFVRLPERDWEPVDDIRLIVYGLDLDR